MSNGSEITSEESRPRQARNSERQSSVLVAGCLALIGGCHHATLRKGPDLQAELSSVTAEDLLSLAVSHARSGDLLRAEQYLSAARQRGHDEAAVVYWLVRVCTAASRYQSALGHAANYLRDHPKDWSLRLIVATIHEALGDGERAGRDDHMVRVLVEDHLFGHLRTEFDRDRQAGKILLQIPNRLHEIPSQWGLRRYQRLATQVHALIVENDIVSLGRGHSGCG